MKEKAFTLVEVILVVSILGILAALVLPTFQGHIAKARESASKDSIRVMRNQIEMYKLHLRTPCLPTLTYMALILRNCPRILTTI